jgi:hypothetical protein
MLRSNWQGDWLGTGVFDRSHGGYRLGHSYGDDSTRTLITENGILRKAPPLQKPQGWATQLQRQRASGGLLGGAVALPRDFGELAGLYVIDEAAHRDVADVRVVLDAGDLAANILLNVLEGVKVRWDYGGNASLLLELVEELIVGKSDHAAIGVIDDDKFLRAQQMMGNDQGTQRVFGGDAAGVANDVGVASFEAEELLDAEARVHAGEDR